MNDIFERLGYLERRFLKQVSFQACKHRSYFLGNNLALILSRQLKYQLI